VRKYYKLVDADNQEIGKGSVNCDDASTIEDLRAEVHKAWPNKFKGIDEGDLKVI
jgi:hypothetical protein